MSDAQESDPMEVLGDIKRTVDTIEAKMAIELESRIDLAKADGARECLQYLARYGPSTASDIREGTTLTDATRPLAKLYHSYHTDRVNGKKPYIHTISQLGLRALSEYKEGQQTTLDNSTGYEEPQQVQPWNGTELNRSQWTALTLVADYEGRASPADIEEGYCNAVGSDGHENGYAVSSRLSELYELGYVGRPPGRPYIYWLTDAGQDLLENHRN